MKISEVMTTDVATATVDTTLEEIATMMRAENVGAIPILDDDDELAGIVTDRDIVVRCIAEGKDATEATAEDILSYRVDSISPHDDTQRAAQLMASRQIRRLPVVENGKLVGIVSIGDLAVKTQDENLIGDTLEDVSQGVKHSSRGAREGADPDSQVVNEQNGRSTRGGKQPTREESARNIQRNISPELQGNQRDVRESKNRARGSAQIRPAELFANDRQSVRQNDRESENGKNTRDDARSLSWQNRESQEQATEDQFDQDLKADNAGQHRANRAPATPSLTPAKGEQSRNRNRRTQASSNRKQPQSAAARGRNQKAQNLGRYAQAPGTDLNNDAGALPSTDAPEQRAGGQRGASRAGRNTHAPRSKDQRQYGKHIGQEQSAHDLNRRGNGKADDRRVGTGSRRMGAEKPQPQALKSDSNSGKQGIANRKASAENRRNDKVVPFREDNRVRNTQVKKPVTSASSKRPAARKRIG